jgi:hypothetical protein
MPIYDSLKLIEKYVKKYLHHLGNRELKNFKAQTIQENTGIMLEQRYVQERPQWK